jgi:hypothetical protein
MTKEYMCLWWAQVPAELRKLREDETLCDMTFVLNGTLEYKMHALVLVCASSQFRNRLNKSGWQNTYFFDNVNIECFRHLLNYVYGCNLILSEANVKDMLYLATMLSIDTAIMHCEEFCNTLPNNQPNEFLNNQDTNTITPEQNPIIQRNPSINMNIPKNSNCGIAVESGMSVSNNSGAESVMDENSSNVEMSEEGHEETEKSCSAEDSPSNTFDDASKELLGRPVKAEGSEGHEDGNSNSSSGSSRSGEDGEKRLGADLGDKSHGIEKPKGKSLEDICAQLASSRQFAQSSTLSDGTCRTNIPPKSSPKSKGSEPGSESAKQDSEMDKECGMYQYVMMPFSSSGTCSQSSFGTLPSCSGGIYSNSCGGKGKYTLASSSNLDLRACAIRREKDKSKYISTLLGLRSQDNDSPLDIEASQSPSLDTQIAPASSSPAPISISTTVAKTSASLAIRIPRPNFSSSGNSAPMSQPLVSPISWSPAITPADTAVTWSQSDNNLHMPSSKDSDVISKIVDSLETMTDSADQTESEPKSDVGICQDGQAMDTDSNISANQSDATCTSSADNLPEPVCSSADQTMNKNIATISDHNKPLQNEVMCTSASSTPVTNTAQSLYPFLNQIGQNLVPVYLPFSNMPNFNGTKDDFSSMIPPGLGSGMPPLQNIVKSVNENLPLPQTLLNGALTQAALQQSQSVAALQQSHSVGDIASQLNFPNIGNLGQNMSNAPFMNTTGAIPQPDTGQQSSPALPVVMANSQTQTCNSSSASEEEEEDEQTPMDEVTSAVTDNNLQQQLQTVLSQQLQANVKNSGQIPMDGLNNLNMNNMSINSLQAAANLNAAMSLYTCMMLPNAAGVPQPTVLLPQGDGVNAMMPHSTSFAQPTVTQSTGTPFFTQPGIQNGISYPQTSASQGNLASFLQPNITQPQNNNAQLAQLPCSVPQSTNASVLQPSLNQATTSPMLPPNMSQPNGTPVLQPGLLPTNIQNTALMAQATLTQTNITPSPLPHVQSPCTNSGALVQPNMLQSTGNPFSNQQNSQALVQQGMNQPEVSLLPQNTVPMSGSPLLQPSLNQLNNASFLSAGATQPGSFLPTDFNLGNPLMTGKSPNMTKSGFNMASPFLGPGNFPLASTLQQIGQGQQYDLSNLCKDMPTVDSGQERTNGQMAGGGGTDGVPVTPGMGPAGE